MSAGMEAGSAWVTILPSVRGFGSALRAGTESEAATAGGQAGGSWARTFASRAISVAGTLGLGLSFAKVVQTGWSTAVNNEIQEIKFDTLLQGARDTQDYLAELADFAARTPFDFPGITDAAGRFLAVGVEADRVIPIMTALGDATALMGTGADGVDRATTALIQMEQKTKVASQEMMQLTEAGIPAWEALAAHLGVTVAQAQDMVTEGAVKPKAMFDALENYSGDSMQRMKGGMEELSTTFTGQWSSLMDTAEQTLGKLFGPLVDGATVALGWFNDSFLPGLSRVPEMWEQWRTPLTIVGGILMTLLGPAFIFVGTQALIAAGKSTIAAVQQGAAWLLTQTKAMASAAVQIVQFSLVAGYWMWTGVQAMAGAARQGAAWLLTKVQALGAIATIVPAFLAMVGGWITSAATAMASAVVMAAAWVIGLGPVAWVIAAIVAVVAIFVVLWRKVDGFRAFWIRLWDGIVAVAKAAWAAIRGAVSAAWEWITGAVAAAVGFLTRVWDGIRAAAAAVWNAIQTVVRVVVDALLAYVRLWLAGVTAVWNLIRTGAIAVWNAIRNAVNTVITVVTGIVRSAGSTITGVWNTIRNTASSVWNAIRSTISNVINSVISTVRGLPGRVRDALSGAASWLVSAGRSMIDGLLNGAANVMNGIRDWVRRNIVDKISGAVKSLFGIGSPSRLMAGFGEDIADGMAVGIARGADGVAAEIAHLADLPTTISPTLNAGWDAGIGGLLDGMAVHVYIGDRELTDLIDVRVETGEQRIARQLVGGRL